MSKGCKTERTADTTRRAFTLIEMMMVVVVIAVLVGLLMPAFHGARKNAQARQLELGRKTLASALMNYRREYRQWPNPADGESVYSNNNHKVVTLLTGGSSDQPIKFINPSAFDRDAQTNLQRPDGTYYIVDFSGNMATVDGTAADGF
jgi:prepilin-type N-terminal cleavage/methylation domain-containing protein